MPITNSYYWYCHKDSVEIIEMVAGKLTMEMARKLHQVPDLQNYKILCSHSQAGLDTEAHVGKLNAWYGHKYGKHALLADLDIAIVQRSTNQLVALIEIEETTNKPKVLLGDALATLLGSRIAFQGKRHWQVGPWTSLIVLAKCATAASRARIGFLQEQVTQLKTHLTTPNAAIGHIVIAGYTDEAELEEMLYTEIQEAITYTKAAYKEVSS